MQITEADKSKLIQLKQFKQFKWFVEQRKLAPGDFFGASALHQNKQDYIHIRLENVKTTSKSAMMVLSNVHFFGVLHRSQQRISSLIKQIPFSQKFSEGSVKELLDHAKEQQFFMGEFVHRQGQEPQNIYIVKSGDFQLLRNE